MPHPPQIPLTPQTDERNFPRWRDDAEPGQSGAKYPKMLTRPVTEEDTEEWIRKNRRLDMTTRMEYWESVAPQVGGRIPLLSTQKMVAEGLQRVAGEPIIVNNPEHEAEVRAFLGLDVKTSPKAESVSIPIADTATPAKKAKGWPKGKPRKARTVPKPRVQEKIVEEV